MRKAVSLQAGQYLFAVAHREFTSSAGGSTSICGRRQSGSPRKRPSSRRPGAGGAVVLASSGVVKLGSGTATLAGANSYHGQTTVTAGT